MTPSQFPALNWPAIGVISALIITVTGWFVAHFLAKRREAQKDERARHDTAAERSKAVAIISHLLTNEEREILHHCISGDGFEKGRVWIMRIDAYGSWVRAGKHDFFDKVDASIQARYLDAFDLLCGRGYARHEGGMLYQLTGAGFERAKNEKK
jgi:hypothetical protein